MPAAHEGRLVEWNDRRAVRGQNKCTLQVQYKYDPPACSSKVKQKIQQSNRLYVLATLISHLISPSSQGKGNVGKVRRLMAVLVSTCKLYV